jgi:hypothetical protein
MKSKTLSQIDQLHHKYRLDNSELDWNQIDTVFQNNYELVLGIDYFLNHLLENHQVPGKVWDQLLGICDWLEDHNFLTTKQTRYATLAIIGYWDQVDISRLDYFF